MTLEIVLRLLGSLALLIYGMKTMSDALQKLMDTVWPDVIVTDRTINVNITRLRKKLGSYAQNIASRHGLGYVFEG